MTTTMTSRHVAMLEEMGIKLWLPNVKSAKESKPKPKPATVVRPAPRPQIQPAPPPAPTPIKNEPIKTEASSEISTSTQWQLGIAAPCFDYPSKNNQEIPEDIWLLLMEHPSPFSPFEGEMGQLLKAMLCALKLDTGEAGQIWMAALERSSASSAPEHSLERQLPQIIAQINPARILVLGQHAAQAVLKNSQALGQMRQSVHHILGIPTVVSYDPRYLLRAPRAKRSAWADLQLASSLTSSPP